MSTPPRPWLLVAAAALLTAGAELIGSGGRPIAAAMMVGAGLVALGAWIMNDKD